MKGHIQSRLGTNGDQHEEYELGFPAFSRLSGAPIFLDDTLYPRDGRNSVVGVVIRSQVVRTQEDGLDSDTRWAIGVNLLSVQDWLGKIDPCLAPDQVKGPTQ